MSPRRRNPILKLDIIQHMNEPQLKYNEECWAIVSGIFHYVKNVIVCVDRVKTKKKKYMASGRTALQTLGRMGGFNAAVRTPFIMGKIIKAYLIFLYVWFLALFRCVFTLLHFTKSLDA